MPKRRKDKRYVKRVNLPDGTFTDVYGHTLEERNENVDEVKRLSGLGINIRDNPTVGEWAKRWVDGYFAKLRPTTRATYLNYYNKYIRPAIAALHVRDVRQVNIEAIMTSVAALSENTQYNVLATMRRMFNVARKNHLIAYNPCDGVEITERSDLDDEDAVLEALDDQQKADLLKAVAGTDAEIFVNLGIWCGLRREESLGLQWGDIDFKEKVLYVRHSVTFPNNAPVESDKLKHKASRREIPIPPPLMDLLEAKNPAHAAALPITLKYKHQPDETILAAKVCPSVHGQTMSKSSYRKFWAHVEAAVPFVVHSHMLRHTYCTWLYDNGVDVETAKVLMGHSDIRITDGLYRAISLKQKRNTRAKIQNIFKRKSVKNQSKQDMPP